MIAPPVAEGVALVTKRAVRAARVIRRSWLGIALAASCAGVLLIQTSRQWHDLASALRALDFDPGRVALIQAWLAGMLLAAVAALLTGRPWISTLTAVAFVGVTYVWPLGARLLHDVPEIFGTREQVQPAALRHNQTVVLAVGFLASLPAAATGDLLRRGIRQWAEAAMVLWKTRCLPPGHVLSMLNGAFLLSSLFGSVSLAPGADPLLRYGPEYGVYRPADVRPPSLTSEEQTAEPVPSAGHVLTRSYRSEAMGEERRYLIYLPPSYGLKASTLRHYPVVYLLHGDPSAPDEWVARGAPTLMDAGSARGALPETILVMPDGNGRLTSATQWANRRDGRDRIEDALLELVRVVDHEYRTISDRHYRVIAGLSSGAFGAANIAAHHSDLFGVAMSFSGYFIAPGPVFGNDSVYIRLNSPYYLVQDQPGARTVFYVLVVGAHDNYRASTEAFAELLSRLRVDHDLHLVPGGHGGNVFAQGLALGMNRVALDLARPATLPADHRNHHRY